MAWPVNASSTWALSTPVWVHWAMKRAFDRLPMPLMMKNDSGTDTIATSASSGEIQIMTPSTPMSWRPWASSWLRVCWRLWAMLSMSLETLLSRSPRCWRSMYDSGRRLSLSSTSPRIRCMVRWTTPASSQALK